MNTLTLTTEHLCLIDDAFRAAQMIGESPVEIRVVADGLLFTIKTIPSRRVEVTKL